MNAPRRDHAGARWLITNRGIAKRAIFETRQDVERFYDALASVVEQELIEIHAFVVMTTHFHVLLTSPRGELSYAMQIAMNAFVRWWNRTRKRDGPVFARRFHGRQIHDDAHWMNVLRYIDLNPVRALMTRRPSDHPWGSARAYRHELWPDWLSPEPVLGTLRSIWWPREYAASEYDSFAGSIDAAANAYLVERATQHPNRPAPPLTDLIRAASRRQQAWMEWKAALADGMSVGTAFLPPDAVHRTSRVIARHLARDPLPAVRADVRRDAAAGLLRRAAGRTVIEVAGDLGVSRSTAHAAIRRHETRMEASPRYADVVARALQGAVRRTHGPPPDARALPLRIDAGGEPEPW